VEISENLLVSIRFNNWSNLLIFKGKSICNVSNNYTQRPDNFVSKQ
jgi:hypothetical protein